MFYNPLYRKPVIAAIPSGEIFSEYSSTFPTSKTIPKVTSPKEQNITIKTLIV